MAKLAIVGVWPLLSGSWIVPPHPPVSGSLEVGALPAAMRNCSGAPLIVMPSMSCACVQTAAMVVNSLMTTRAGGSPPTTASSAIAGLLPAALLFAGMPPPAVR